MAAAAKVLADILATDMSIDPTRIVLSDENFKAPKDDDLYVIIIPGQSTIIANTNRFDPDTDEEVKSVVYQTPYNVELTSKNTDARDRRFEVLQAIKSTYSQQQQEIENIRIFRTRQNLRLSFIEGASSLHRYRITVIIQSMEVKRTAITPIDKFPTTEVANGTA